MSFRRERNVKYLLVCGRIFVKEDIRAFYCKYFREQPCVSEWLSLSCPGFHGRHCYRVVCKNSWRSFLYELKKNALCGEVCPSVWPFLSLSVCDLESASKEPAGLLRNSVQEIFTKICRARVSFVKIGLESVTFYSKRHEFLPLLSIFLDRSG